MFSWIDTQTDYGEPVQNNVFSGILGKMTVVYMNGAVIMVCLYLEVQDIHAELSSQNRTDFKKIFKNN